MAKSKFKSKDSSSRKVPKKLPQLKKTGLPPGSLVYTGQQLATDPIQLSLIEFDGNKFFEKQFKNFDAFKKCSVSPLVQWLDVDGVHDVNMIEAIGDHFGIHALTLEDVLNVQQRAKFEEYNEYIVVILKMIHFDEQLHIEQVTFVLTHNILISFQEKNGNDAFEYVRNRIRHNKGRTRRSGADYLLYSLMDAIVDGYFEVLEKMDVQIEDIEIQLIENPEVVEMSHLHYFKRQIIDLRKAIYPVREMVAQMERFEHDVMKSDTDIYLRDLKDHITVVLENIESYRDLLGGLMDLYLSTVSNRMNEVMKVLTIISTLFIPVTFIAGVYGMNFDNMPELHTQTGYFIVVGLMATLMFAQLFYFKRKGWM